MTSGGYAGHVQGSAQVSASLDNNAISRGKGLYYGGEVYNRIRRCSRARSAMDAGIAKWKGYKQLRFMTLTSSKDAEYTRLNPDFEVLKKRLKTHFGSFFEYVKVKTSEGKGVIHIIYAGPFIPQTWLSRNWGEIHGSPIVDIRKLYFGRGLRNYLSSYLQGQGRLSYSWGWFKKGWASSYRRLQADKKRAYVLVGRLGLKAPLFCLRAWSRWFYRVYNPILFEWFVAKYAGEEDPPKKSREEPINQALIDRLKQRNARSPSDIF